MRRLEWCVNHTTSKKFNQIPRLATEKKAETRHLPLYSTDKLS